MSERTVRNVGMDFFIAFTLGIIVAILAALMASILSKRLKSLRLNKMKRNVVDEEAKATGDSLEVKKKDSLNIPVYTVHISDIRHPERKWMLPLFSELLIGRGENCAICLEDHSVSKRQCQIEADKNGLFIINLSRVNLTRQNELTVDDRRPLRKGDILTLGREMLRIDEIQSPYGSERESFSSDFSDDFSEMNSDSTVRTNQDDVVECNPPHITQRFW